MPNLAIRSLKKAQIYKKEKCQIKAKFSSKMVKITRFKARIFQNRP